MAEKVVFVALFAQFLSDCCVFYVIFHFGGKKVIDASFLAYHVWSTKSCSIFNYVCCENLVALGLPPTEIEKSFRLFLTPKFGKLLIFVIKPYM